MNGRRVASTPFIVTICSVLFQPARKYFGQILFGVLMRACSPFAGKRRYFLQTDASFKTSQCKDYSPKIIAYVRVDFEFFGKLSEKVLEPLRKMIYNQHWSFFGVWGKLSWWIFYSFSKETPFFTQYRYWRNTPHLHFELFIHSSFGARLRSLFAFI